MFSAHFYKLFGTICTLASGIGVVGFTFDPKQKKVTTKLRLILRSRLQFFVVLLQTTFYIGKLMQILHYCNSSSQQGFYICYIFTLIGVMEFGGLAIIHRREDDLVVVMNQLLAHMTKFTGQLSILNIVNIN